MEQSFDEMYWASRAKVEQEEREAEIARAERAIERQKFLEKLLPGGDMLSWLVPRDGVDPDEVLAEHLAQLRNAVRYALQYAIDDNRSLQTNLAAATTVQRLIRTNVALAKVLKASSNSKTVRGSNTAKDPQD